MNKKIFSIILILCLCVSMLSACKNKVDDAKIATNNEIVEEDINKSSAYISPFADAIIGDVVSFGSYEQNADNNGKEAIEWIILDKKDDKVLVLSKYGLDCQPYSTIKGNDITWENCTLREWLNDDFLETAFTNEEQKIIELSTLVNENVAVGGKNTSDYVFLLSLDELKQYFSISDKTVFCGKEFDTTAYESTIGACSDLICKPTKYAFSKGCIAYKLNDSNKSSFPYSIINKEKSNYDENIISCEWFIRTPGYGDSSFLMVDGAGIINKIVYSSQYDNRVTRPAMWVRQ